MKPIKRVILKDAVAALLVKLADKEIRQLEELYQPHPVLGLE